MTQQAGPDRLSQIASWMDDRDGPVLFALSQEWRADILRAERAEAALERERAELTSACVSVSRMAARALEQEIRANNAEKALERARALLAEVYDDSPCRLDHHGNCQEHIGAIGSPCWMRRVEALLGSGGAA